MSNDEECVYCDVMMTIEQGVALLGLINHLRDSSQHPLLDEVFRQMQSELEASIEFAASGSKGLGDREKPKH